MTALQQAQQLLNAYVQSWQTAEANRVDAVVLPEQLLAAVKALEDARWGYLAAITGLDPTPPSENDSSAAALEVLYHFCCGAAVLTLRVTVPYEQPKVPSVCALIPYASIFERELGEMFGIEIQNAPDNSRLFLPDDWPEGVYPLRKAAKLE